MARLVDADELEEKAWRFGLGTREDVVNLIRNAPTVEPKHGYWIPFGTMHRCSVCGETVLVPTTIVGIPIYDYCPNCGAKMDEVEDE